MAKPNRETERFFLSLLTSGYLLLYEDGRVYNSKTERYIGVVGSGKYKKISVKDFSCDKIRHIQVHRLMWLWFKGPIEGSDEVDHKDGDTTNCTLGNLQLLTPSQNTKKNRPDQWGFNNPYYKHLARIV